MFEQRRFRSTPASAAGLVELIYVNIVRDLRSSHGNAVVGLVINLVQMVALLMLFVLLMSSLGFRSAAIRGDFMVYVMSGVFLYMTHIKAVGAVFGSAGPVSGMMMHAPMNTMITIFASALSSLYTQVMVAGIVLFIYHCVWMPITIDSPVGALSMLLLAWFSGVAVGMVFLAAKPWAPRLMPMVKMIYMRANMLASGKMFVANMMPGFLLPYFTWNPLFHCIDQARGYAFLNYNPHYTSITYPLYVALVLIMIGLLAEFYTRVHASISWRTMGP